MSTTEFYHAGLSETAVVRKTKPHTFDDSMFAAQMMLVFVQLPLT
jgi:hypothetical protein